MGGEGKGKGVAHLSCAEIRFALLELPMLDVRLLSPWARREGVVGACDALDSRAAPRPGALIALT